MYIKVVENKELETGITIHYVNETTMKKGAIIQKKCCINSSRYSLQQSERKIHELEQEFFPLL
jgi:phosphoribosylglycinamide formyltransferase-1